MNIFKGSTACILLIATFIWTNYNLNISQRIVLWSIEIPLETVQMDVSYQYRCALFDYCVFWSNYIEIDLISCWFENMHHILSS